MTTFNGAGKIHIMPINKIRFNFQNFTDFDFEITEIEAESSYNISTIQKQDGRGLARVLGGQVEMQIYVPYNYYKTNNLIYLLDKYKNKPKVNSSDSTECFWVRLTIGGDGAINQTDALLLVLNNLYGNVGIAWQIESVEYRPRLIVSINAIYKNYNNILWG